MLNVWGHTLLFLTPHPLSHTCTCVTKSLDQIWSRPLPPLCMMSFMNDPFNNVCHGLTPETDVVAMSWM